MRKAEAVKALVEGVQRTIQVSERGECAITCKFLGVKEGSIWYCKVFDKEIIEGEMSSQERCEECKKLVKS